MDPIDRDGLKRLASKYIWWKTPDEAISKPDRVIAQVMNIGDYADVQALAARIGEEALREVLIHAEASSSANASGLIGITGLDLPLRIMFQCFMPRNSYEWHTQATYGNSAASTARPVA